MNRMIRTNGSKSGSISESAGISVRDGTSSSTGTSLRLKNMKKVK